MSEYRYPQGSVLYRKLHKSFPLIRSGRVSSFLPSPDAKVFFLTSGSEAI